MLKGQKHDIPPRCSFGGTRIGERCVGHRGERRMYLAYPHPRLAPAGSDVIGHLRMLREEPQKLPTGIAGGADDRDAKPHQVSAGSQAFMVASWPPMEDA